METFRWDICHVRLNNIIDCRVSITVILSELVTPYCTQVYFVLVVVMQCRHSVYLTSCECYFRLQCKQVNNFRSFCEL